MQGGHVRVAGRVAKASARLRGGEAIEVELPPPEPSGLVAQDLPLSVLHEDRDLVVLDKAAGMVVHPARGAPHSTVVNALLHRLAGGAGERLPRIGLVHRLDKDTSGCLVVAKTEAALAALQAQWKGRTVEKIYLALCHGALAPEGRLDTPYGRHARDRTRFTGRLAAGRRAVTEWKVLESFGAVASLAEVTLHTGRTHQNPRPPRRGRPPAPRRRRLRRDTARGAARPGGPGSRGRPRRWGGRRCTRSGWPSTTRGPVAGSSFEAPLPEDLARARAVLRAAQPASGPPPAGRRRR